MSEFVGDNKDKPKLMSKRKGDLLKRRENIKKYYEEHLKVKEIKVDQQKNLLFKLYIWYKPAGRSIYFNFKRSDIVLLKNILARKIEEDSWPLPFYSIKFEYRPPGSCDRHVLFEKPECVKSLNYLRMFLKEN